ncbi:MAG: murein biosynthesis integral membrane protein MurJ [Actinomycetes bacterium]
MSETSVLRSSGTMALGTVVSRITGFARDMVLVGAIGTQVFADAYNVANTVPTIIYILLIGGALNAVFVPHLIRAMKQDFDGGEAYAQRLVSSIGLVLVGITIAAVILAPLLVLMYAADYRKPDLSAEFHAATTLARYLLPQIFFLGIFTMLGQVLNARGRFGPMMWTPVLNNAVVIVTGVLFIVVTHGKPVTAETVTPGELRLLGIGTALGVIVQALALVPVLRRTGFHFKTRFDLRGVGLRNAYRAAAWTVLFVLINQIGYLVIVQLATAAGAEASTAGLDVGVGFTPYTKAHLIMLLPHAIVAVSVVTALLPRMSRSAVDRNLDAVRDDLSSGLRMIAVATVPAACVLLVLGREISTSLYGLFTDVANASYIGYVLQAFAIAVIPFSAQYLLLRGFYSLEDTRTPVGINVWINVANIVFAVLAWRLLPLEWRVVGIAAGYGLAYVIGLALTVRVLGRRIGGLNGRAVMQTHALLVLAAVAASLPALVLARGLVLSGGRGFLPSLIATVLGGGLLVVLYLYFAARLRIPEVRSLIGLVTNRFSR